MQARAMRLKDVVSRAVALPPGERRAFIAFECSDDTPLALDVLALVAAHDAAGSFMGGPTNAVATATADEQPTGDPHEPSLPARERIGSWIGHYRLLELIGEGGFGSVFLAQQNEPIVRRVALKIIKAGMDSRMVAARFEAERQALALMDHPHIARVFDGGVTIAALGSRPYFVMEYVKGDPITSFADAHRLPLAARLGLFIQVCQAVQHAHTKGVIHRDIKPNNVLVNMTDGRPFAKVIDFGIAKATGARLTDKTLFTEHRQLIGTPEYMSPEQAEGSPDIDTRTDVYALGVLLYELLTGTTPFDGARLRSAAFAEMQRIIKEEDPPAPSLRLSRDLNVLAAAALARTTEPERLGTAIRGELDWIVMKSLDKDRARRYESPNQLAVDVQRHLAGEAVLAAPPSAAYRLAKFMRRHKGAVLATGATAAALVVGIMGTSAAAVWALRERDRASSARAVAQEQVDRFRSLMASSGAPIPTLSQAEELRAEWTREIEWLRAQLAADDATRVRLEAAFAAWLWNSGQRKLAEQEIEAVAERARRVLAPTDVVRVWLLNSQMQLQRSRGDDAASLLPLYAELATSKTSIFGFASGPAVDSILEQACLLLECGRVDEGVAALRDYLDRRGRGHGMPTPWSARQVAAAVRLCMSLATFEDHLLGLLLRLNYHEARAVVAVTADVEREIAGANNHLVARAAVTVESTPDSDMLARLTAQEARIAAGVGTEDLLEAAGLFGGWLWDRKKFAEAEQVYGELASALRARPLTDPTAIVASVGRQGGCRLQSGRAADAEPLLRECLAGWMKHGGSCHPSTQEARGWLGECLVSVGKFDEAEEVLLNAWDCAGQAGGDAQTKRMAAERLATLYSAWKKPADEQRWRAEIGE